jgi:hypothetical protein
MQHPARTALLVTHKTWPSGSHPTTVGRDTFDHRYRYPILWATWLAAAYLFEGFFARQLSPKLIAPITEPALAFSIHRR